MSSTEVFLDTDINQAKLLSQLSGRPAKVQDDVFVWNGHLIDRATAVVALLKVNNQVPVGDGVKLRLQETYNKRFSQYNDTEDLVGVDSGDDPKQNARIWFNIVCRKIKGSEPTLSDINVRQILIDLHS